MSELKEATVLRLSSQVGNEEVDFTGQVKPESRTRMAATRIGSIIGKTALVCLVSTPFVIFAGTKIVDYMNETGVRTLRDGMDQQNGTLTGVRQDINDGVPVDISGIPVPPTSLPTTDQATPPNTTVQDTDTTATTQTTLP